jgi:hypothetical protein
MNRLDIGNVFRVSLAMLPVLAAAPPAPASQAVQTVTTTLSAPVIGNEITVNGQIYKVQHDPQNDELMQNLQPGDQVDLLMLPRSSAKANTVGRVILRAKAANQ